MADMLPPVEWFLKKFDATGFSEMTTNLSSQEHKTRPAIK
jgi:hypothetical protein